MDLEKLIFFFYLKDKVERIEVNNMYCDNNIFNC